MTLKIGLALIVLLVTALILGQGAIRKYVLRHRRARRAHKRSQSHLSTRADIRSSEDAYCVLGPSSIREVCDNIPTIDEHGRRRTVIRTRTLETVLGPVGPVEVERDARYTLPGYGHVARTSETEFETFQDHVRLRLDVTGNTTSS
jgi:hypothetical protein